MADASVRPKKSKTLKKQTKTKAAKPSGAVALWGVVKKIVKSVHAFTAIYAFMNILFWLAYSSKLVGQTGLYIIFKPAWNFVNLFYTYKPVSGKEEIDFTGVVCAIILMVIAIVLKSVSEFVTEAEENAKIEEAKRQEKIAKRLADAAIGNKKKRAVQQGIDTGFVFVLDVDIKQVAGFIQEDMMTKEDIVAMKTNFYTSLLNNLNLNQVTQKGYFKKKLFLVYKEFAYVDDFIFYTRETLTSLSGEFTRPTLRIDFVVGLNAIRHTEDIREKLDILDTIGKLKLKNEFICTQAFRECYDLIPKQQYRLVSKGVYNLSKNLNVSNNQEIYSMRESR